MKPQGAWEISLARTPESLELTLRRAVLARTAECLSGPYKSLVATAETWAAALKDLRPSCNPLLALERQPPLFE